MTQAVTLNFQTSTPALVADKPWCTELIACIQAIWNSICVWIYDLASRLLSWNESIVSTKHPYIGKVSLAVFRHITEFLEPLDIAQCEAVNKSWKDKRIWQAQATHYGMKGGSKKEFKKIHEMAFGKKAWKEHLKADPGNTPRLPVQVYRDAPKFQETHILTLIPETVDGKELSFNSFAPLAEKAGMKLNIWKAVSEKYGSEPVAKAIWVWMQKDVEPGSRGKTQAQAEQEYPNKLGKALYYTVSIVAHYARDKICLMPEKPQWTYTRTCDGGQYEFGAWYVVVGCSAPGVLGVRGSSYADDFVGVAGLVLAHSV